MYNEDGEAVGGNEYGEAEVAVGNDDGFSSQVAAPDIDPRSIMINVVAPAVASAATLVGGGYLGTRAFNRRQDNLVATFASEMVYHANNLDEMSLCYKDTKKKLIGRRTEMVTAYLELFMKKKVITTSAISSLSYVFSLFGLSENKAAELLVLTATNMRKAPASRGKLLFFGERILKSPEGRQSLQPIRDMLASNYRSGGEEIVEVAQRTMGESAYKSMVVSMGPEQTSLTKGWDLLGVPEDVARSIYDGVALNSFKSDAEDYYAHQAFQPEYDKDGNLVVEGMKKDEDPYADMTESQKAARGLLGNDKDKEDKPSTSPAVDDDDVQPSNPPSTSSPKSTSGASIYECSSCGYTLFPAKGREFKFFPEDYVCPECGGPREGFVERGAGE
ncbi:hypothetical protein TrRE_jg13157 [Triparma retinervis]|uniref:Rubredoxin-like domain-containing protein n=1 Tax=Triparma retinervis TaxID=2557542 RepID=A0A9W6ZFX8_9STRA|nr:hypothetical protein TrRE_jg13157 [Triparma retinervis]